MVFLLTQPYDPNGTDKDTQVSRDRDCRLSEWDIFPSLKPKLQALLHDLALVCLWANHKLVYDVSSVSVLQCLHMIILFFFHSRKGECIHICVSDCASQIET